MRTDTIAPENILQPDGRLVVTSNLRIRSWELRQLKNESGLSGYGHYGNCMRGTLPSVISDIFRRKPNSAHNKPVPETDGILHIINGNPFDFSEFTLPFVGDRLAKSFCRDMDIVLDKLGTDGSNLRIIPGENDNVASWPEQFKQKLTKLGILVAGDKLSIYDPESKITYNICPQIKDYVQAVGHVQIASGEQTRLDAYFNTIELGQRDKVANTIDRLMITPKWLATTRVFCGADYCHNGINTLSAPQCQQILQRAPTEEIHPL